MKREIWVWHRQEHETSWIWSKDLEDANSTIQDTLREPTPYPEDWRPAFPPGEEVVLDWNLRYLRKGRIISFLGGWTNGEEDMEVYEVVEEDPV